MDEDEDVLDAIAVWYCLVQAVAGAAYKKYAMNKQLAWSWSSWLFLAWCMHEVAK